MADAIAAARVSASEDKGATPVELVLAGLGGCLNAGIAAVAQNRKIQLRSVKSSIEGGMNILGEVSQVVRFAGMYLLGVPARRKSFIHGAEDDACELADHVAHYLALA